MADFIEAMVRVPVNSQEEAEKILDAVYSGLAGELLRMGVIYGQMPFGGVRAPEPMSARKSQESAIQLQKVEDKVGSLPPTVKERKEPVVEKARPHGLAGRTRLGRS